MLVERHSRFTMLVKVSGKDSKIVVAALSTQVKKLPDRLRQSLTWDRGMELADHKIFILATDIQCISVILEARGNAAPTSIRIGSFCNTFWGERISPSIPKPSSTGWRTS